MSTSPSPHPVQTLLETLCSQVSLANTNDTQSIFILGTLPQAQLAHDLLAAYGFDVRLYPENATAKLYITQPINANQCAAALSHAQTLHDILDTMHESEHSQYRISFSNTPTMGKQISIFFPPPTTATDTIAPATATSANTPPPLPVTATTTTSRQNGSHQGRRMKHKMLVGPTLAKKPVFEDDTGFRAWIRNYFSSYVAEVLITFVFMFFLTLIVVSVIVLSKGFICPDLATVKKETWYCKILDPRV